MARKRKKEAPGLIAQLKDAIRNSGKSLYELGKDAEVGSDQLSRFMRGKRTLTLPVAERLCHVLHLRLIAESQPAAKPEEE